MPRYLITEVTEKLIDADSEEDALARYLGDPAEYGSASVAERWVEEVETQPGDPS